MTETKDDLQTANAPPTGRWEFDASVTASFDDMLQKSVPNYAEMRRVTTDVVSWHVDAVGKKTPVVVDLGASRGTGLAPVIDKVGAHARYLACDVSEPMLDACRQRFSGWIDAGVMEVRHHDLREGFPNTIPAAAILSVLTLQFVPIEYRQRLLRGAYESLLPRGAMVVVEKVLGATAEMDGFLVDLYHGTKREHGYSQEAIDRKRLALEGVLVPLTAAFNEDLLRGAGFDSVDCVWGFANFRMWIAQKRMR